MRVVKLAFTTEVTDPRNGKVLTYPRMSDGWCDMMSAEGYVVINTEQEHPINKEENAQ